MGKTKYKDIALLKKEYQKRKPQIKKRLSEFKKNKDMFYELCLCILTPQSNAKKCFEAVNVLKRNDFLHKDLDTKEILKTKTRFYKNKAEYLLLAKKRFDDVKKGISKNGIKAREFLVENVKGVSWKESSHLLRNIGYRNLAIIDRHLLKNLKRFGVIDEIPRSLSKKQYFEIESKFKEFSKKIGIEMDELDLLFWSMETGEVFR